MLDPFRLGKNLPPTIFARALNAQHCQQKGIEFRLLVLLTPWKQKVRLRSALAQGSPLIANTTFDKDDFEMVLECKSHAAFPAVLHRKRELKEPVHIILESTN